MSEREKALRDVLEICLEESKRYGDMPRAGIASVSARIRELLAQEARELAHA